MNLPTGNVAIVVAHPDDETIGCGALLCRLKDVSVVIVTDGAPADGVDARALGFEDRKSYAAARAAELDRAMDIAAVPSGRVKKLGVPDQQTIYRLDFVVSALAQLFAARKIDAVLTHAYEGGHPDHDATALCVHRAARAAAPPNIGIFEMPYYRLGRDGMEFQTFPPESDVLRVVLTEAERATKQRMIDAHRTQRSVLAAFSLASEQFRIAPSYDFSRPPNGGRVLYDSRPWGVTSAEWLARARSAQMPATVPP
jgi:LmbE family N-acetylglucosaminyl deacetylase